MRRLTAFAQPERGERLHGGWPQFGALPARAVRYGCTYTSARPDSLDV